MNHKGLSGLSKHTLVVMFASESSWSQWYYGVDWYVICHIRKRHTFRNRLKLARNRELVCHLPLTVTGILFWQEHSEDVVLVKSGNGGKEHKHSSLHSVSGCCSKSFSDTSYIFRLRCLTSETYPDIAVRLYVFHGSSLPAYVSKKHTSVTPKDKKETYQLHSS